ncbi:DUF7503 family protein [Halobacterium sp. MBLA0001]
MSMTDSKFTQYLSDNPRMIGALFTMLLFLSTTGTAAAKHPAGIIQGP